MSRFDSSLLARALAYVGRPQPAPPPIVDPADEAMELLVELCKRFEGFRSRPYLCPAGVPTIGYGSTRYADGRAIQLTDPPISELAAERLLVLTLRKTYLPALVRACPVPMSPGRAAALGDWTYNLGAGNLMASTLRRKVNAGRWDEVPAQLRRWIYAAGKPMRGLVIRRDAEAALI